ncbi:Ig-specific serine endopeptidase MIP [Mycoplasmopsis edwardii]|nr:DUF31 family protein [Mycoplasmopsis edwardii]
MKKKIFNLIKICSLTSAIFSLGALSSCNYEDAKTQNPTKQEPETNNLVISQPIIPENEYLKDYVIQNFEITQLVENDRHLTFWFSTKKDLPTNDLTKFSILINDNEYPIKTLKEQSGIYTGLFLPPSNITQLLNARVIYNDGSEKLESPLSPKNFEITSDKLGDIEVTLTKVSNTNKQIHEVYPTEVNIADLEIFVTGGNSDSYSHKIKNIIHYTNQKNQVVSNWLGALVLEIEFTNKTNEKEKITRKVIFQGFKFNPFDGSIQEIVIPTPYEVLDQDYTIYEKLTYDQRFVRENVSYLKALKSYLNFNGINPSDYHPNIDFNAKKAIFDFDQKAKEQGIDSYESSYLKGFTLPKYDAQGNFLGLALATGKEVDKAPLRSDWIGRNQWRFSGLARSLVNDHYKRAAMQTYSIEFTNPVGDKQSFGTSGTIWILDFQKPSDSTKYPTKWYFGTNLHVADALKNNTSNVILTKIKNSANLDKEFSTVNDDADFERFYFNKKLIDNGVITKVFEAKDFLNSKPADYLFDKQKEELKDHEEYSDFAVLEFDFSKINSEDIWAYSADTTNNIDNEYDVIMNQPENFAKLITNNYANKLQDHIKFKANSYLKNYDEIDNRNIKIEETKPYKGDQLYAVGYPASFEDYFLLNEDGSSKQGDNRWSNRRETNSLWTNSDPEFYWHKNEFSQAHKNLGNYLSNQIGYRTFTNKPGIVDSFLTATHTGDNYYLSGNDKLIGYGLSYSVKGYVPYGGSSGSSFRNQNNEIVGVFYAGNGAARTGLMAAFRSEGHDYHGLFGDKYKLPEYDLIYGGGENQKNSYREALKAKYPNIQTNLFPNGLNEIPDKFKFNK